MLFDTVCACICLPNQTVSSEGRDSGAIHCCILITKHVRSYIQLFIQQILIKCPLCISHCTRHWDANVNKADRVPLEISVCCSVAHSKCSRTYFELDCTCLESLYQGFFWPFSDSKALHMQSSGQWSGPWGTLLQLQEVLQTWFAKSQVYCISQSFHSLCVPHLSKWYHHTPTCLSQEPGSLTGSASLAFSPPFPHSLSHPSLHSLPTITSGISLDNSTSLASLSPSPTSIPANPALLLALIISHQHSKELFSWVSCFLSNHITYLFLIPTSWISLKLHQLPGTLVAYLPRVPPLSPALLCSHQPGRCLLRFQGSVQVVPLRSLFCLHKVNWPVPALCSTPYIEFILIVTYGCIFFNHFVSPTRLGTPWGQKSLYSWCLVYNRCSTNILWMNPVNKILSYLYPSFSVKKVTRPSRRCFLESL